MIKMVSMACLAEIFSKLTMARRSALEFGSVSEDWGAQVSSIWWVVIGVKRPRRVISTGFDSLENCLENSSPKLGWFLRTTRLMFTLIMEGSNLPFQHYCFPLRQLSAWFLVKNGVLGVSYLHAFDCIPCRVAQNLVFQAVLILDQVSSIKDFFTGPPLLLQVLL